MGLDSTNRDDSFWDTIGTQTTTRDTIFHFGTQFRPFGTQSGTVFVALALALALALAHQASRIYHTLQVTWVGGWSSMEEHQLRKAIEDCLASGGPTLRSSSSKVDQLMSIIQNQLTCVGSSDQGSGEGMTSSGNSGAGPSPSHNPNPSTSPSPSPKQFLKCVIPLNILNFTFFFGIYSFFTITETAEHIAFSSLHHIESYL